MVALSAANTSSGSGLYVAYAIQRRMACGFRARAAAETARRQPSTVSSHIGSAAYIDCGSDATVSWTMSECFRSTSAASLATDDTRFVVPYSYCGKIGPNATM